MKAVFTIFGIVVIFMMTSCNYPSISLTIESPGEGEVFVVGPGGKGDVTVKISTGSPGFFYSILIIGPKRYERKGWEDGETHSEDFENLESGEYRLVVKVRGMDSKEVEDYRDFIINERPRITDMRTYAGDEMVSGSVEYMRGMSLRFVWETSDDGEINQRRITVRVNGRDKEYTVPSDSYTFSEVEPGEISWKVDVWDNYNTHVESEWQTINVLNFPPNVEISAPRVDNVPVNEDYEFQVTVTDGNLDEVELKCYLLSEEEELLDTLCDETVDTYPDGGKTRTITVGESLLEAGKKYKLYVRVVDNWGGKGEDEVEISTTNDPDVRLGFPLDGNDVWDGYKFTWKVEDIDGDPVTSELHIKDVYGKEILKYHCEGESCTYTLDARELGLKEDNWYKWYVIAWDDKGGEAESEVRRFKYTGE